MNCRIVTSLTLGLWLAACGSPSADEPSAPLGKAAQAAPTAAQTDAVMRAAGYVRRSGKWMGNCGDPGEPDPDGWYDVEIDSFEDLNKDGRPEALIAEGGSSYCFGMAGYGFTLMSQTPSGWTALLQGEQGMAALYDRPGQTWPDIEVGGPGSDCFAFLRWNGAEYAYAGRSLQGRICELDPEFAQTSTTPAPAPARRGALEFPPVPKGYYAFGGISCRDAIASGSADMPPAGLLLFDQVGMGDIQGRAQIEGFDDLGGGRYRAHTRHFGNGGLDNDPGETDTFILRVTSPTSFVAEYEYEGVRETVAHVHCLTDMVPRAIRESWLDR